MITGVDKSIIINGCKATSENGAGQEEKKISIASIVALCVWHCVYGTVHVTLCMWHYVCGDVCVALCVYVWNFVMALCVWHSA